MGRRAQRLSLSVIIPTCGRAEDVRRLLASLERDPEDLEVIVVDDGSPDPQVFDPVKREFPKVCFIHSATRGGAGAARNQGARQASGDILMFLDSDTELVPGSVQAVRDCFGDNPHVETCSGGISLQPINEGFFPKYKALLEAAWLPDEDAAVTFVAGRCFAVRKAAFLAVGGFGTDYRGAGVEDFELGYRLRERFGHIRYLKNFLVRHKYPTLWKQGMLYYRRVILWLHLRPQRSRHDNVGTTPREALINALSALLPWVLTASVIGGFALPGLLFAGLVIGTNRRFLTLCVRDQGYLFAGRALAAHCYLATWICAGGIAAVLGRRPTQDPMPGEPGLLEAVGSEG